MVWQDIVIGIASALFAYSLVFQVYVGFKEKKGFIASQTSLLTTIGLYMTAVAYFTLNLYISAIIILFSGTMWLLLLVQRLIYKKA
ncbi:MAG: hypothetical protein Q8L29_02750 [archaeon]|nr:hypothetical protein [archaeon]